jgi:hypothetical protein
MTIACWRFLGLAAAVIGAGAGAARAWTPPTFPLYSSVHPGDVLVCNIDGIDQYSSTGTLLGTYYGNGSLYHGTPPNGLYWWGVGATAGGQIVFQRQKTVGGPPGGIFTLDTLTDTEHQVVGLNNLNYGDVSVFGDGVVALNLPDADKVSLFAIDGSVASQLVSLSPPGPPLSRQHPGSATAPDGTLWVRTSTDNATVFYHMNKDGTGLTSITLGTAGSAAPLAGTNADFVVDAAGNLWMPGYDGTALSYEAMRYGPDGSFLGAFPIAASKGTIGLGLDGSLYFSAADASSATMYRYGQDGSLLGTFDLRFESGGVPLTNGGIYVAVVPEPATVVMMLGAGVMVFWRRRFTTVLHRTA